MLLGESAREERNSMNTIEGSDRRRERKRTFSIGNETGFYTERARKKKR